ncbi:SHIRT domain-containing protein, partial [uncultured Faecalicoccus sp.]|uniref:SHIRT domain-containing protein n=1 Tax=uncultured Faecalicoccus sp. TaxID=1971760 RepID=UPI0025CBDA4C
AKEKNEKDYTTDSWKDLQDALEAAEKVNKDPDATVDEVQRAEDDLEKALEGLKEIETISLVPEEDLTGYTGGTNLNETSGFPNMRYTFNLPEGVDPSEKIKLYYKTSDGKEGSTTVGDYPEEETEGISLLAEGEDANTTEPVLIPELEPSYKLNGEEVTEDGEAGVYSFEVKNDEDLYAEIDGKRYKVNVEDAETTVTIRYVSDPEGMAETGTDYINAVENEDPSAEVSEVTAVVDPNTTYLTNDKPDIAVMNEDAVGLLVDELLSDDDGFDREKAMLEKLNGFLDEKDLQTVSEGNYDFMYLDLVNTVDGNAWVSSTRGTDIYLPYPEGTNEETEFTVVHFPGLHREYGFEGEAQVSVAIEKCQPETMAIEKTDKGIKFHVDQSGFSPFALTWSNPTKEFDVSYAFKSEDGRVLPQEVNALLPAAQKAAEGSTVTPAALTATTVTTHEGVWTFKGWDQQSVTVSQSVVFTGTWSFTANPSEKPVFDLSDVNTTLEQGSKFDPMAGVHATDAQGNDITASIKVVSNNVDTSKPGKYTVTYEVTDQYGNTSQVTVEFTVKAKETSGSETVTKDDLKDLIDQADKLDPDQYTKDSWDALEKALEEAKKVYKDSSATAEEINSAYNALNKAMKGLKKVSEKGDDADTAAQLNAALYGGIAIVALGAMLICVRKRSKKS